MFNILTIQSILFLKEAFHMPIYNGMLPVINKDEVKRYAGLRHAEDFPEKFVDEACKEIQLLATPKGVYQEYDYDAENKVILSNPPLKIEGSIIEKTS